MSRKIFSHNYLYENTLCLPPGAIARFGKGGISDIATSSDGNLVAVASRIGVWLYDAHTEDFLSLIAVQNTGMLSVVALSPDCTQIATGDWDGKVALWDVDSGKNLWCVIHEKQIESIDFSQNGRRLGVRLKDGVGAVLCVDDGTHIPLPALEEKWSRNNIKSIPLTNHPQENCGWFVTFSPNGKHLAGLNKDNSLMVWDIRNGEKIRTVEKVTGHGMWISMFRGQTLGISSVGRYCVISFLNTGAGRDTVRFWNEETLASFTSESRLVSAAASPDGRLFATGGWDRTITLWSVETEKSIRILSGHTGEINALAFSFDGRLLVSGGAYNWIHQKGEDGSINHSSRFSAIMGDEDGTVRHYYADDNHVDKMAKVWEVSTGANIATLENQDAVREVAFSLDGTRLATASRKHVNLWCTKTWQPVTTLETVEVESLAFSFDSTRLAIGGTWPEQRIQIWDVEKGQRITELSGHKSDVESVAFSPDGHLLASGGFDGVIYLWDIERYNQL